MEGEEESKDDGGMNAQFIAGFEHFCPQVLVGILMLDSGRWLDAAASSEVSGPAW